MTGITSHVQLLRSALAAFIHWWGEALRGLVPMSWRRAWNDQRPRVVLELGGAEAVLRWRMRGRDVETFRGDRGDLARAFDRSISGRIRRLVVMLRADLVFRRTLLLPASAEPSLARVIANEIDRQTPFSSTQVYFDYRISNREVATKQLAVELVVVKRATVDELKAIAARFSFDIIAIGLANADGRDCQIDFLVRRANAPRNSPIFWLNWGLTAAAIALAIATIATSLQELDNEIAALAGQVREVRAQAQRADGLRREIAQLADGGSFLARRKQAPSVLGALRDMTTLVPDDAWTYEFQILDGQLRIAGYAADAPGLIGRLERSSVLRDPKFRAPVTRIANRNIDRFDLSMEIRPPGARP